MISLKKWVKIATIILIYCFALIILVIYSLIGYNFHQNAYLALIFSLAALTTDVISFIAIFDAKKAGFNPIFNAVGVIIIRVILVAKVRMCN